MRPNLNQMLDNLLEPVYMRPMSTDNTTKLPFMKMHGLGNDFVVMDARAHPTENRVQSVLETDGSLPEGLVRGIAHRQFGIGFDQLAVLTDGAADAHLTFYNADGSTAGACGNATRCIARYLMDQGGVTKLTLTTDRGTLQAVDAGNGLTSVNMGQPQLQWDEVPLAREMDTLRLPIDGAPTATGMGNPHCSFFVPDVTDVDLESFGAAHEHHPLYPERTNVQIAHLIGPDHLRMRVWERGVGITLASGSSSCAVAVAAARRGLTGRAVTLELDGGTLAIDWREDGVWMTGPTMHVASGEFTLAFVESCS